MRITCCRWVGMPVLLAVVATLCVELLVPDSARAQTEYTFTKIADTLQDARLAGVGCLSLGNSGTVAVMFAGELWKKADGQPFSQVSPRAAGPCASVNDFDEIAYVTWSAQSTLPAYLVRNTNGIEVTLARSDSPPFLHSGRTYLASLANDGSAVFQGGPTTACGQPPALSGYGIYIGPFGAIVYDSICDAGADINSSTVSAGTMNESRVVAFYAQTNSGLKGVYRGSLVPLVQDGSNGITLVSGFRPVINNSGRVAFLASLNSGPAGIYTTVDGLSFTYAGGIPHNNRFAINDAGKVAYAFFSPLSGTGIYAGPDLAADKVIVPGDALDGSTFDSGFFWDESLNNRGQIAFYAFLRDGRRGVYRADPVNRPPIANDDQITTPADTPFSGVLSATDADNDPLTYQVVANGAQGTAIITDATTGAYTYTPNVGASGTDAFTFLANDGVLDSNVAAVTVTIQPATPCAVDVTSSTQRITGKGQKNQGTTHILTISNVSSAAIAGPISVVLDSLSPAGATLTNAAGITSCATPAGNPYVNVDVGPDLIWSPGERVEVVLEFTLPSSTRGKKPPITYTLRVLAGPGGR